MSDPAPAAAQPSLAARIDQNTAHPLTWQAVAKRAAVGRRRRNLAPDRVFPAITEVLASWPRLFTLDPRWFALAIGAEVAHFACTFALQRLALRTKAWFPVVTSQLAGNAITLIMPWAERRWAPQFRMLAASGRDTSSTVGGSTACSLLGVGGLLALPVFALPVILVGAPTNRGLVNAAILGAVGFVVFAALGGGHPGLRPAAPLVRPGGPSGPGTGSCASAHRSPGWTTPCSPSAMRSGRPWAINGGRRCCSPPGAWRSTTCAC